MPEIREKANARYPLGPRGGRADMPETGERRLVKLVSRPAVRRPEESRRERLSGPSRLAGLDEDDPRAMARRVNMTGKEPGEDAGDGFAEDIDRGMEEAERGTDAGEDDDE